MIFDGDTREHAPLLLSAVRDSLGRPHSLRPILHYSISYTRYSHAVVETCGRPFTFKGYVPSIAINSPQITKTKVLYSQCCCCPHIKSSFLPSFISTPSVLPESLSQRDTVYVVPDYEREEDEKNKNRKFKCQASEKASVPGTRTQQYKQDQEIRTNCDNKMKKTDMK